MLTGTRHRTLRQNVGVSLRFAWRGRGLWERLFHDPVHARVKNFGFVGLQET